MMLEKSDVELILRITYPEYRGRKFQWVVREQYQMMDYWSEGSRTYCKAVSLDTSTGQLNVHWNNCNNPLSTGGASAKAHACFRIPDDVMLVEHVIFCGKDMGIRFVTSPGSVFVPKLLPAPKEQVGSSSSAKLSWAERVVLTATRSLKSSYGGISNYRFHESAATCGITLPEWEAARSSLVARGLLDKRGAITNAGRNIIGQTDLFSLRREWNDGSPS